MSRILKSHNVRFDPNAYIVETKKYEAEDAYDKTFDLELEAEIEDGISEAERVLLQARREADSILREASQNAENLKLDVHRQCEISKQEIEEKARDEGYSKGRAEGLASLEELRREAEHILENAKSYRQKVFSSLEGEMVGLISGITEKLLGDSSRINPGVILNLIRQGMSETTITGDVKIRVSEQDYGNVVANREYFMPYVSGNANIEIIKDPSLGRSDCIIETSFGNIDVSVDRQFDELRQSLYYIYENR